MEPNRLYTSSSAARPTTYDAGLRSFFQSVYNTMAIGLVFTGLIAYIVANTAPLMQFFYGNPIMHMIVIFAPLAFVFFGFTPRRIHSMNPSQVAGLFYVFSGVFGISLAYIFKVYTGESIARVFFITAGMFAATSIYGYTTKKDLSKLGSLMIMGAIGLLIAMLVNLFLKSAMMSFVISGIGVIVYTGLVAWDTQNLKEMYNSSSPGAAVKKMAVMGAFSLYMNFIMLFQFLLQFLGNRN